ncbi:MULTISPECIES: type III effector HrpK domain-containing protein [Rhodomicrobium]|uniref:type III effector HrpK domain-containing protein n=1 Tax=Rhodomicrobium TaxID=1068 RepID=UPI000B4A6F4A|nr:MULTISPECIES: type III effector HrpK domain-containing protein [Rhodomicrobium]
MATTVNPVSPPNTPPGDPNVDPAIFLAWQRVVDAANPKARPGNFAVLARTDQPPADAESILDNSDYSKTTYDVVGDMVFEDHNLEIWDGLTADLTGDERHKAQVELNRPIAAVRMLIDNWDAWGMHKGVSFANPPSDLPPEAQVVLKWIAANPELLEGLDLGGGTATDNVITKADAVAFLEKAREAAGAAGEKFSAWVKGRMDAPAETRDGERLKDLTEASAALHPVNPASPSLIADPDVIDPTADPGAYLDQTRYSTPEALKVWDDLTAGMSEEDKARLKAVWNRPLAAAQMLSENWEAWGMNKGRNFGDLSGLPPEAQAALKFITDNHSLINALDVGGGDTQDNTITHAEVDAFIEKYKADIKTAGAAYKAYVEKNGNAGDLSKSLARDAALVAANRVIIGEGHTYLNSQQLSAFADANPGLSEDVRNAARLWSNPGMLRQLDMAGDNPATSKNDGTFGVENVKQWLGNYAPKSDAEFINLLNGAATLSMVDGVDTSKLGPDVFAHPENYDGKTKAAVMMQLLSAVGTLEAGVKSELWNPYGSDNGINPNKDKVKADLLAKIELLANDKDVQTYLADGRAQALQSLVNADPNLKSQIANYYDGKFAEGGGLNDILAMKDDKGNPISLSQGVQTFAMQGQILHMALGREGKPDLAGIVGRSGHEGEIRQYYLDNIVSGKSLKDAIAGGTGVETALSNFSADVAAFNMVLDPQLVADNAGKLETNLVDIVSDEIFGTSTQEEFLAAFGDGNGNLDETKLRAALDEAQRDNPQMFTDASGTRISTDAIVGAFRGVWDDVRQGAKLTDALAKLNVLPKPDGTISAAYGKGMFHIVSAAFMGGILIARGVQNGTTPQAQANKVAAAMQFTGLLLEGSSKYTKSLDPASRPANWLTNDALGKIENYGKLIGGVGGLLAGGFGIAAGVNSLNQGDNVNGGISLTGGILGIGAGIATTAEAIASLFGAAPGLVSGLGVAAGVLGIAAAGFAAIAVFGLAIWEVVKHANQQEDFYANLNPILEQYGITGGPKEDGDLPPQEIWGGV